ncbi:MAG: hypothetical protein HOP22_13350 [Nitrospiraceae bacterium]|nr:hypothetical protein [Nitrospiraceae bacterium]
MKLNEKRFRNNVNSLSVRDLAATIVYGRYGNGEWPMLVAAQVFRLKAEV